MLHRRGGGGPRVIRLDASTGDDGVGALRQGFADHPGEFPDLVASESERNRVVSFDEEGGAAADGRSKAVEALDRGGIVAQADAREGGESIQWAGHLAI